jgi:hypothetical protein
MHATNKPSNIAETTRGGTRSVCLGCAALCACQRTNYCVFNLATKCSRAGFVKGKLLISSGFRSSHHPTPDYRHFTGLKAFSVTIATTSMTCR